MNRTKTLTGWLHTDDYGFLCLENENSPQHCGDSLASQVQELNLGSREVFLSFFVFSNETTEEEADFELFRRANGLLEAEQNLVAYSEYTIEEWTENLSVGGHNLIDELSSFTGKYLILNIRYEND